MERACRQAACIAWKSKGMEGDCRLVACVTTWKSNGSVQRAARGLEEGTRAAIHGGLGGQPNGGGPASGEGCWAEVTTHDPLQNFLRPSTSGTAARGSLELRPRRFDRRAQSTNSQPRSRHRWTRNAQCSHPSKNSPQADKAHTQTKTAKTEQKKHRILQFQR